MNHSPLLLNEHPLLILPSLAVKIGLNEAVIFQQVHYWLTHNEKADSAQHFHDDRWWTYGTYEQWQDRDFPFLNVRAVRRAIKNLEDRGLLITGQFNRKSSDRTKWYSIDYEALARLEAENSGSPCGQIGQSKRPKRPGQQAKLASSSISTETNNTETISTTRAKPRKEGGGSERVPLLDSEGSNAKEIAEWLCSEYWYHQIGSAEPLRFNCTRYLVDACKGHTKATARDAMLAFWEAMLGYVDINESINKPERFLAMRLKDREPLSAGNRERVLQYEQEVKARYHRKSAADYNRRWLAHAESAGILLDVRINEADQFYSFWYGDTGEPGNLNLWDLPPRYAHVTIDQLMKVPA